MYKSIFVLMALILLPASALAQGNGMIHALDGKVWINGVAADKNSDIHFGDQIITAGLSQVTISLDGSVYRIASSSKLTLPEGREEVSVGLLYGAFLAVFRRNIPKTVRTRTAVMGVRGTGIYLSERDRETYLCACYGDIDFIDAMNEGNQGHVHATYHQVVTLDHESRVFNSEQLMLEHTDADLFELEAIAGRAPPETFSASYQNDNIFELKVTQ